MPSFLPYHEPSFVELIISSSILLALNSINSVLDRTVACGLVGQSVVTGLGYLGLILVVFAGGVSTDVVALKKNLVLSVVVAVTGVVTPIALSFALLATTGPFLGKSESATPLQAFAAGAALCSTSLGTTFSVPQASSLSRTRLGAVIASAALLDDVVGLVVVRIITNLGQAGNSDIEPAAVLRPVLVSAAFAIAVPLACRFLLRPGRDRIVGRREEVRMKVWIVSQEARFVVQTALLMLLIVAATFAGASILLAAYITGVVLPTVETHSNEAPTRAYRQPQRHGQHMEVEPKFCESVLRERGSSGDSPPLPLAGKETSPPRYTVSRVYDTYYAQAVNFVLKPFFFLFVGEIIWRGIIYSILMIIGKLLCGLWLVRFLISINGAWKGSNSFILSKCPQTVSKIRSWRLKPTTGLRDLQERRTPRVCGAAPPPPSLAQPTTVTSATLGHSSKLATPPTPLSLYPAAAIGCAMVARGKIGFLISLTAESQGVFRRPDESASEALELFLIITWAIFLCTIVGPLCAGLLVRRVKKLEKASEASGNGSRNVLGVWGVG
ncbi:Sodium/hydrogen exchanger [Xylariaceae sp. FL1651]|nr:Sodium/hydrogen exchanger [Xylariaceae sp. FL1651]